MLRYDFVETLQDGYNQLAQVLVLLKYSNQNNSQSKFFAIVRYLKTEPIQLKTKLPIPFQVYTWELPRSRQYLQRYSLQMIDVASILSPVFIHSYLDEKNLEAICSTPKTNDKFWYVPRLYCDRADYDKLYKDNTDIHAVIEGIPEINNFVNDEDSCIDDYSLDSDDLFNSDEEYEAVTNTRPSDRLILSGTKITNVLNSDKENSLHPLSSQLNRTLSEPIQGNKWVEIRHSLLPGNSGWGLFAKKDIPAHFMFCTYEGIYPKDKELNSKTNIYDRSYVASIGIPSSKKTANGDYTQFVTVDAIDEMSCFGRFINDPIDESYVNSKLTWNEDLDIGVAISTDPIPKGDEIYLHYGDIYWKSDERYLLLHQSLRDLL